MRTSIWTLWISGLVLKLLGAAWDVSWHFRSLRETISPPHMINMAGFALISVAFLLSWKERTPKTQAALNVILVGFAAFLAAIPFDEAWHRIFGLDLTTWSPSHLLLFSGTAITLAGVVLLYLAELGWTGDTAVRAIRPTRSQWAILGLLLFFLVEAVAFPLTYNEYVIVGAYNLDSGQAVYEASDDILAYAPSVQDVQYGDLPHALYPTYTLAIALLLGVLIRRITGKPGMALAILGGYSLARFSLNGILVLAGFPEGAVPWHYVLVGLAIEAAYALRVRMRHRLVVGTALATAGSYAAWWVGNTYAWTPFTVPLDWTTLPWGIAAAVLGWLLALSISDRIAPWVEQAAVDPTPYAGRTVQSWLEPDAPLLPWRGR